MGKVNVAMVTHSCQPFRDSQDCPDFMVVVLGDFVMSLDFTLNLQRATLMKLVIIIALFQGNSYCFPNCSPAFTS